MHLYELLACLALISSVPPHFCVSFCIFMVSIKNLDLDWPLSGWGYGDFTVLPMPSTFVQ